MTVFPGVQGEGIQLDSSLYIRIAALLTVPIMLVVSAIVGKRTAQVSHKYSLVVTPPGPFFAIWGVIYIGLIVSGIYSVVENVWSLGVTVLFGTVCLLNGLWVFIFDKATTKTNNICTIIVFLMLILNELQWIWMEIPSSVTGSISTWNIVNRNIFAFYQGWLVGAFNLNLGVSLVYTFGISKKIHTYIFWIVCPLFVLAMVLLNISYSLGFINNIAMYFSAGHALIGAFISTRKNFDQETGKIALM